MISIQYISFPHSAFPFMKWDSFKIADHVFEHRIQLSLSRDVCSFLKFGYQFDIKMIFLVKSIFSIRIRFFYMISCFQIRTILTFAFLFLIGIFKFYRFLFKVHLCVEIIKELKSFVKPFIPTLKNIQI